MSRPREGSRKPAANEARPETGGATRLAGLVAALWLLIIILKIGNPLVLYAMLTPPRGLAAWLYQGWPIQWGMFLAAVWLGLSLIVGWIKPARLSWIEAIPLCWIGWVLLSFLIRSQTGMEADRGVAAMTVLGLLICAACFYAGLWGAGGDAGGGHAWWGAVGALVVALVLGMEQQFGGLESTRRYVYETMDVQSLPEEYRKRLVSGRIFASFLYPNTFAGAILLFLPVAAVCLCSSAHRFGAVRSQAAAAALTIAAGACLYWTRSKGAWLVALVLGVIWLSRIKLPTRWRIWAAVALMGAGLILFFVRFGSYFEKGATSVGARFDYWNAAGWSVRTAPVFGLGPGSFGRVYARIKRPESEITRLVHNDYLQQGAESGLPGMAFYILLWIGVLGSTWRCAWSNWVHFGVWLGLVGFALQSLFEFGLYIPAIAWPAFFMAGWLARASRGFGLDRARTHP